MVTAKNTVTTRSPHPSSPNKEGGKKDANAYGSKDDSALQNNGSGDETFNVPYPSSGKRLMSSFAVTDCLQVVSGTEFFVFDPTGTHLFSGPEPVSGSTSEPMTAGAATDRYA